jgi:hypothetical protein
MFRILVEARDRLLAALGTKAPPPKPPAYERRLSQRFKQVTAATARSGNAAAALKAAKCYQITMVVASAEASVGSFWRGFLPRQNGRPSSDRQAAEYQIFGSAQANIAATFASQSTHDWVAIADASLTTLSRQTTYSTCASILVSISRPGFRSKRIENSAGGRGGPKIGGVGGGNRGSPPHPFPQKRPKKVLRLFFDERNARKSAFTATCGLDQVRKKRFSRPGRCAKGRSKADFARRRGRLCQAAIAAEGFTTAAERRGASGRRQLAKSNPGAAVGASDRRRDGPGGATAQDAPAAGYRMSDSRQCPPQQLLGVNRPCCKNARTANFLISDSVMNRPCAACALRGNPVARSPDTDPIFRLEVELVAWFHTPGVVPCIDVAQRPVHTKARR